MSGERVLAGWIIWDFAVSKKSPKKGEQKTDSYTVLIDFGGFGSEYVLPDGMTLVQIHSEKNKLVSFGLSRKADKDEEHAQKGVKLALKRALDQIDFTKEQRTEVWSQFRAWIESLGESGEVTLNSYV